MRDFEKIFKEKNEEADYLNSLKSSSGSQADDDDHDSAGTEPCAEIGERVFVSRDEDEARAIIEAALGAQRSIDDLMAEKTAAAGASRDGMDFSRESPGHGFGGSGFER